MPTQQPSQTPAPLPFVPGDDSATFTLEVFQACLPATSTAVIHKFYDGFLKTFQQRQIWSKLRMAHFIAQASHESMGLMALCEFVTGSAYEGRKDLGNTQPGDGIKYKGRGVVQITGRANYQAYGKSIGLEASLLETPQMLERDPWLAVDSFGWFWQRGNLSALADQDNLNAITRKINGGVNGLGDRLARLVRAKLAFQIPGPAVVAPGIKLQA